MEISGEMSLNNCILDVVMAKLSEVESLVEAFNGCRGVFHTGGFVDPAGLSGYTVSISVFFFPPPIYWMGTCMSYFCSLPIITVN